MRHFGWAIVRRGLIRSQGLRRGLDLLGATIGLIALTPLFILIAVAIRVDSPGPVFFRQGRVGFGGRVFQIWKFRTMRVDAGENGPRITIGGDPRITRVGRHLRRWKLDELPQLLNVLDGSMGLVGPRPEIPEYVEMYGPRERKVLGFRPGMTDPASLKFRNEELLLRQVEDPLRHYEEVLMPQKVALNLEYARRATAASDLGVILRTIIVLFTKSDR